MNNIVISIKDLYTKLGTQIVHQELSLDIHSNEIVAIVGDSGCGKTTLLRVLLMLQPIVSGEIHILGRNLQNITMKDAQELRMQWGVMFQNGALFNDFTVLENIIFPIKEFMQCSNKFARELAEIKLLMCGLPLDIVNLFPYELSGGMIKRTSAARAIALDPKLLFLDEPTVGLDPNNANAIDELILSLKNNLGLTVIIVTHDLDTLSLVPDKIFYLSDKKVLASGSFVELKQKHTPKKLYDYFNGVRAKRL